MLSSQNQNAHPQPIKIEQSIIVHKYGGSSMATPEKIKQVASRVVHALKAGKSVVVVVSAMGDTTNQLIALASQVSPQPQRRELDMLITVGERISMALLSMAIQDLGYPAVSFTGSQSGIITTDNHSNARIIKISPHRIQKALSEGKVVIVAGFQGVSEKLEITSLGRGGSDTTAVALAAALNAEYAEICSDVDGVYSADPRVVEKPIKQEELAYEEMQNLADAGAKVLNAEAVEWARRSGIEIRCVATQEIESKGTQIKQVHNDAYHFPMVSAVTHHPSLYYVQGEGFVPLGLIDLLASFGIVDAQINSNHQSWQSWIPRQNLHQIESFETQLQSICQPKVFRKDLTQISLVGRGLLHQSHQNGILVQALEILKAHQVEIFGYDFHASALSIAILSSESKLVIQKLHQAFIENPS
jgi:aspartate kinase